MFEWLVDEIAQIKTRKFHLVDGPASADFRDAVESCDFPLPPSYREFVLRFGNAKLYRYSSNYYLTIFADPLDATSPKNESFIQFGRTWISNAYFKESLLSPGRESPVFESFANGTRQTASGFEDWINAKSRAAKRRFKKKDWKAIEKGPAPFTEHERAVVEARKLYRWRVVGIAPNEDLRFEVHNGSSMNLPYLSIGIRGKLRPPQNGPLEGGAFLPVASIGPGETQIVEFYCYKNYISPRDTEAFELPDPGPEDRNEYWEFQTNS